MKRHAIILARHPSQPVFPLFTNISSAQKRWNTRAFCLFLRKLIVELINLSFLYLLFNHLLKLYSWHAIFFFEKYYFESSLSTWFTFVLPLAGKNKIEIWIERVFGVVVNGMYLITTSQTSLYHQNVRSTWNIQFHWDLSNSNKS